MVLEAEKTDSIGLEHGQGSKQGSSALVTLRKRRIVWNWNATPSNATLRLELR
jgi:hypothetical protein